MLPISLEVKAICNSVVGPTCAAIYIVIMLYHFISTYKHSKPSTDAEIPPKLKSFPLSLKHSFILILIGFWCVITLNLILIDSISTESFCHAMLLTGPPFYIIFKLFMYLILTARAKEFFADSTFAYSVKKLRIWNGILILWTIFNAIGMVLLSNIWLTDNERPRCSAVLDTRFTLSMVLLDAVGGFGSSYLLVKPMLKMAKMEKEQNNNIRSRSASATKGTDENVKVVAMDFSSKFKAVARKQSTLSIISVVTSWFALIMMALTNMHSVFVSIDLVVSAICILLIYTWNQWIFDKLCVRCRKQNEAMEDVKNLDIVVQGDITDKNTRIESINTTSVETDENRVAEDVFRNTGVHRMTVSSGNNAAIIH